MILNISFVRQFFLILFTAVLLNGLLVPASGISLAQPDTDASVTNSTDSNFLTYEDTARGFKMQYPSDWKKSDYPPTIPIVGFMSPAQNATDRFFENIIVTTYPLSTQNVTLDQVSHELIEQLDLTYPEFDVISPPKETMLGGIPAYNLTYTFKPPEDLDPPMVAKPVIMQMWTLKGDMAYGIGYGRAEGQIIHNTDIAAKNVIDSFELLPPQQISISKSPQIELDNVTSINQTGNNFLTYSNSTYGIKIGYPQNWNVSEYPTFDYGIAYIFPDSENETTLDLSTERLPFQETSLDDYLDSRLDFSAPLNLSESNTNTTTLAGRPAYKLVYYEVPFSNDSRKVMELGTIINGRVYEARYSTSPDRFLQNLPIIQRMLDTLEIVPTNKPPVPPSVNDREFLTYENSTLGIKIQYPSGSQILVEDVPYDVGFRLPDEEFPESSYDTLFIEVYPLPLPNRQSQSMSIDTYIPSWISWAKENLSNFNLSNSKATTLEDSPAQLLVYTYADPDLGELKGVTVLAIENNILYTIGYESIISSAYYDHIPIIQKMIASFEILDTKGMPKEIF
ncbi:hypothetical protein BH18THE2_BH18THE2_40300 [soil metagenome]